ncbi:hypothetical protein MMC18_008735 [Xylographa bjoerkii]|nr:hypothetical protein [Xylographa bjoerkii]
MVENATSPTSENEVKVKVDNKSTLTPPASEEADKNDDSGSELSDLEPEVEDNGEVVPDHYYEGGKIPVFKPTMEQFRSFKTFVQKIDKYGMKSGIVKVIPPQEWRDSLPQLDERIKTIKVKNPITQEFHGTHGTYTQANIEKQRSYNLPQWKALSEESNHQPPARRGERRRNQEKVTRGGNAPKTAKKAQGTIPDGRKRGPGRPRVRPLPTTVHKHEEEGDEETDFKAQVPPTPTSPSVQSMKIKKENMSEDRDISPSKPKGRQPKSVSSRRKHNSRDQTDVFDEEAFKDFDYRVDNQDEWTPERCQELETAYWKSLTFNNPMYGADMPGSLFDDSTESWNVSKLENLLDVLGQKIPGVNTTYLYLGMWKATFAWHLEDVDLYSINYIHFGAPKQWYSISQEDARRFEAAMRNVWPNDAKNCDQFLRHKTYLISPQLLQSQYNIKVNRLVHNEGEFVITYPYGYHSGYNLGYNCAESVNFATESWLDYGRVAKKCNCEADSVWVDVADIERKLRGEQTPEYYEETDDDDGEDEDDDEEDGPTDLPTPPGSDKGKPKVRSHKRKRDPMDKEQKPKIKRLRIKISVPAKEPCVLCPNDNRFEVLLPTDNGQKAHRRCALYTPETYIVEENGAETICDVSRIDKARLELKCNYCRNKRGAVFQCSQKKCTRAYHATCAASAGVQVDIGIVPVFGEDGTEYTDTGIDFRCRFHRVKRPKSTDKETYSTTLEESSLIRKYATKLPRGEVVQVQYFQGDIFAGVVLENRKSEQTLLIELLPKGDTVEVEYKWLLVFDPANSQLPIPSGNAKPLPAHLARKSQTSAEDPSNDIPKQDEPFCDPEGRYIWSEFNIAKLPRNVAQVKIDLAKPKQLWFYLGKTSTEAKAQYTADLTIQINDLAANFLESVKPVITAVQPVVRRSYPASFPTQPGININAVNAARVNMHVQQQARPQQVRPPQPIQEKPYNGKYAIKDPISFPTNSGCRVDHQALHNQRAFLQTASTYPTPQYIQPGSYQAPPANMRHSVSAPLPTMAEVQRRQSIPQNRSIDDYRRFAQTPHQQYHQHQQPQLQAQPQAPVANMMSSGTPPGRNPFSRRSSSHHIPSPTSFGPVINQNRSRSASIEVLIKYPYLYEAALKRPAVYQSPYATGGGFTKEWLPNPAAAPSQRLRTISLSQDFLMQRTPSQQEYVKTHVRHVSAEKALFQQQQQQEIQKRQLELKQQALMPPPISPPVPLDLGSHHPMQQMTHSQSFQPQAFHQHQPFSRPQQFVDFQPPYNPPSHTYPHLFHQDLGPFPSTHTYQPPGLQFQSPRDFQLQMQREAQQSKESAGYEAFLREMQEVGNVHPHAHSRSDVTAGGDSGSPLRQGMRAAGGEMLPMMRDQY